MRISKQARRAGKQLFQSCIVDRQLEEAQVRQTVQRMLELKPRGYLAMLHHFQRLVKLEIARRTARVESAEPLSNDLKNQVRENLTGFYGPGLNISFHEKPGLIGGMRVQVGSDVFDGSIKAKLQQLQHSF
jgi:F-type H+-transporting ATPase subunit delta